MLWGGFVWDDSIHASTPSQCGTYRVCGKSGSPLALSRERGITGRWSIRRSGWSTSCGGLTRRAITSSTCCCILGNTLLLWHLLRRLPVPGAWVVAAVFAVHPLHVESVAWIIERKDVLSGLFYLAAVLAWMRFVEQPRPRMICVVAGIVCGRSFEQVHRGYAASGSFDLALVETGPGDLGRSIASRAVWDVVGLVIIVGDLSFYQSREVLSLDYSLIERTLIAARALWFYAGKLLWPSELAVIYPLWDVSASSDLLAWGYLIAAVSLMVALWHFRHKLGRGPLAGALFFVVTLSPVLGFVDYGYMQFAFVADRFQYLAGIGVMGCRHRCGHVWRAVACQTYGKRACWVVAAVALSLCWGC